MITPTERRLQEIVAGKLRVAPEHVPLDRALMDELGLDSFDVMGVVLEIEQAFAPASLSDADAANLRTLREVAAHIDRQTAGGG